MRMPPIKSFDKSRNLWETPRDIYKILDAEFHFDFDPCPSYPIQFDGLACRWGKRNFVNPPYEEIYSWLSKAMEQSKEGKTSVFLIPARTGSRWFHELVLSSAKEIRFLRGRIKFCKDSRNWNAPFDSMIVIF